MRTKASLMTAIIGMSLSAHATVLTFQIQGFGNGSNMSQGYGDNVTATTMGIFSYGVGAEGFTPNVTVDYGPIPPADPAHWTTGYGDLTNVLYEDNDNEGILEVTLTAAPGWLVQLHSWDMAAYNPVFSSPPTINWLRVRDGLGNVLLDRPNEVISETAHNSYDFSANPFTAQTLILTFNSQNLGNLSDDIAFDNVRFGQVVPEPATMAAVGLGLAVLARRRRRTTG